MCCTPGPPCFLMKVDTWFGPKRDGNCQPLITLNCWYVSLENTFVKKIEVNNCMLKMLVDYVISAVIISSKTMTTLFIDTANLTDTLSIRHDWLQQTYCPWLTLRWQIWLSFDVFLEIVHFQHISSTPWQPFSFLFHLTSIHPQDYLLWKLRNGNLWIYQQK